VYTVSTLVFFGMIFAVRSEPEKIILSDLKKPPDRLKKHVPDGRQFLCHKKPKLKQYIHKNQVFPKNLIFMNIRKFMQA